MQLVITASKDSYITDKIISNSFRVKNSNAGHAATLDLFKLFEESGVKVDGNFVTSDVMEKSVLLIKFDYKKISELTSSILNINSPKFKAFLELKDVSSGLQKPYSFDVKCNPLKKDFQEGFGIDTNSFSDIGSTNYLTASFLEASPSLWNVEGAASGGGTGSSRATGKITVADAAGFLNTTSFTLSDGVNSVTFTSDDASENATKVDDANYTFGSQNNGGSTATMALRIFTAIALSKANSDLKITASDPSAPEVAVSFVDLTQDETGLSKNTTITAVDNEGVFTFESFSGGYNESHLDFITSGSYNGTKIDFGSSFYFNEPNDNLILDVTSAVSASIKGLISNKGFRIGFSGSYDTDKKTRFVKRFGSRHIKNKLLVPKLRVVFDDSYTDSKDDFYLDVSNDLFLKSRRGSKLVNLTDAAGNPVTGNSCGTLVISSGSYVQTVNFSQLNQSSNDSRRIGVYKASLEISSGNEHVRKALTANQEGFELDAEWRSNDANPIVFKKDKIKVKGIDYSLDNETDIAVAFKNLKSEYFSNENIKIKVSMALNRVDYAASKVRKQPENFFEETHFEIREMVSKQKIISKDLTNKSTKLSFYNNTYFGEIIAGSLASGTTYEILFCSLIDGSIYNHKESFKFKVIDA